MLDSGRRFMSEILCLNKNTILLKYLLADKVTFRLPPIGKCESGQAGIRRLQLSSIERSLHESRKPVMDGVVIGQSEPHSNQIVKLTANVHPT